MKNSGATRWNLSRTNSFAHPGVVFSTLCAACLALACPVPGFKPVSISAEGVLNSVNCETESGKCGKQQYC